jgi:hypothetical protein
MTTITGWLFWLLLCASLLLLARSFYVIYVKKTASRLTAVMAWFSLAFMACYWSWYFFLDGRGFLMKAMS